MRQHLSREIVVTACLLIFKGCLCNGLDKRFLSASTKSTPLVSWSPWSVWSDCSATCSSGTQFRVRHCEGGTTCVGKLYQTQDCTLQRCLQKVDGGWSNWLAWADCSVTCGDGVTLRTRQCNNPAPQDGGSQCVGIEREVKHCRPTECPIDGGWTNYTARPCSKTCGIGVAVYIRTCTNPAPEFNGKPCDGSGTKFDVCNEMECVIDGGWSNWSTFSDCKVVCGEGHTHRSRTCSNPAPKNGGQKCVGDTDEINECSNGACPPDIKTCDKQKVSAVLGLQNVTPSPCIDGNDVTRQVDMIASLCNAPANETVWKLGISVADNCEAIPLRSPLGLVHRDTKEKKYGILLNCFQEKLEIATQTCSNDITTQTINITKSNMDYHLLLW